MPPLAEVVRRAGLSVSAMKVSELEGKRRIDAEYYQPHYLELIERLRAVQAIPLSQIATIAKSRFTPVAGKIFNYIEISEVDTEIGRVNSIELYGEEAPSRAQYVVSAGDVIISSVRPNRNAVALISEEQTRFVSSSGFIVLHPNNVSAEFLFASLKSNHVRILLDRLTTATMYPAVSETDILGIPIIIPSAEIIAQVEQKVVRARKMVAVSDLLYTQAQSLIDDELRLDKLDFPYVGITTRRFTDITATGRIDAEYYHPDKAYAQAWLLNLPGKTVGEYFQPVREIYNPPKEDTGQAILNFDLTDALHYFVDEDGPVTPEIEIGSIKKHIKHGDVIISRLRSYLKEIALVEIPDNTDAVGSSEFIVLRPRSIAVYPEVLIVYLRSELVQTILKWSQDGSNHPRFQEEELLSVILPDQVIKIQEEIRKLIQSGIQANRDAKQQLAEAKAEVERMVGG